MIITCGIYLYSTLTSKILLCHPTRTPWNNWSIPKGLMEPNEDNFQVAARELKEETGIGLANINVVSTHNLPSQKYQKQNKALESFLVITDTDLSDHKFTCNLVEGKDFAENDKWKWVEAAEVPKWVHDSQKANVESILTHLKASGH